MRGGCLLRVIGTIGARSLALALLCAGPACKDDGGSAAATGTAAGTDGSSGTAGIETEGDTDPGLSLTPCPEHAVSDGPTRVACTLDHLASFGPKGAGTPGGIEAGQYLHDRFVDAGLLDVVFEEFSFLAFVVDDATLELNIDGQVSTPAFEVFAYSGVGTIDAEVVYLGSGHPGDYDGIDVTGKVVMVDRDQLFHRSSQFREVVAHGGVAMFYRSASPENLIQIGTVADPEDGLAAVPALTVGSMDGRPVLDALQAGRPVRLRATVNARVEPATGRNVVGWLPGSDPAGNYIVVGAHYDTWYTGSTDNGTGVAALLEIAETVVQGGTRRLGLAFVGYDGEELGLFGGYDFLRRHGLGDQRPLAFVNLEMPANGDPTALRAIGVSNGGSVRAEVDTEATRQLYPFIVDFETVTELFGGTIPTDIQGMVWNGLQGFTTVTDTPYYHTTEDTPDKVDPVFLGQASAYVVDVLDRLDDESVESFRRRDEALWVLEVSTVVDGDLRVNVVVRDAAEQPRAGATVRVWIDVDDFTRVHDQSVVTQPDGTVSVTVPAAALQAGTGRRWLHVTAADAFPLAEAIVSLD